MKRLLGRAFRATALVGVTLALAACSAQTPEHETGSTTVPGTGVGVAQISQPVTTVGLGGAKVVIPANDLVTPAQQVTKPAQDVTKVETDSGQVLYVEMESGKVIYATESATQLGAT